MKSALTAGIPLDDATGHGGGTGHGGSDALYLRDPDGNGVALFRDQPGAKWPRNVTGALTAANVPFYVASLLTENDE